MGIFRHGPTYQKGMTFKYLGVKGYRFPDDDDVYLDKNDKRGVLKNAYPQPM
jgi:hypothetical protein